MDKGFSFEAQMPVEGGRDVADLEGVGEDGRGVGVELIEAGRRGTHGKRLWTQLRIAVWTSTSLPVKK